MRWTVLLTAATLVGCTVRTGTAPPPNDPYASAPRTSQMTSWTSPTIRLSAKT